ncbi:MAG: hypothetical protein BEN19_05575 [Epulopiscium sp. Nuni2H_MBin003]|nr:MAG: hypothetical protein BEN19_05575 [Epulopiscium sp. Nuni2H_MBin003]
MVVKNIMIAKSKLTMVKISDTVEQALCLINSKNLLSLPVVEGDKFVGIISKKYIFEEYFNVSQSKEALLQRPVSEFMKTTIESVNKDDILEIAIQLIANKNRQFIPVVDDKDEFVGILTHNAIFGTFTNILGFGHTRMIISTHDVKGRVAKLAEIISKQDGNIISIVQIDVNVMNLRQFLVRVDIENPKKLADKLEENGFRIRRID